MNTREMLEGEAIAPKGWTEIEGEAKHTALPWVANRLAGQAYGTIDWEIISPRNMNQPNYNPTEKRIATLQTDDEETKANARFICQAVNCHDELVEALGNLLCHHRIALHPQMTDTLKERIDAGRKALSKAKGGA